MDRRELEKTAADFCAASPLNRVDEGAAISPELAGMTMYDPPLVGVAAATDPFFETLCRPGVVGPHFRAPRRWLPEAASVISLFLPFTDRVIVSNRSDPTDPSPEWLHARIEGHSFLVRFCLHLTEAIGRAGYQAVVPAVHGDFASRLGPGPDGVGYTSNWSERHVAHVAGLGTFGLSSGLITRLGMAGRLGSIVTDLPLAPDPRPYSRHDEYCTHCGVCVLRCHAGSISLERGRDKSLCAAFLDRMMEKYSPRYGCGKCQVAVPCERAIPAAGSR